MSQTETLTAELKELAKKRDAVILAHNYQRAEIQDAADIVGDSLAKIVMSINTKRPRPLRELVPELSPGDVLRVSADCATFEADVRTPGGELPALWADGFESGDCSRWSSLTTT